MTSTLRILLAAVALLLGAVITPTTALASDAAHATPRFVTRSAAVLQAATDMLRREATIPGTSWSTDPVTNRVRVSADSTVTGTKLAQLQAVLAKLGDTARLERLPGTLRTTITGGDAIYGGPYRCSLGFNVNRPGTSEAYFLTAGHCANAAVTWSAAGGQVIGTRAGSSFPGNDYALIRYTSSIARPGAVNLYNGTQRDISGAGNAYVGQTVGRSGSTTGFRTGKVTALNVTVNYSDGTTVTGMIATTVCAEGGDSGGALFAGNTALGLTSGGSGNCTSGGQTFFQPIVEALNAYGVRIY
ncbi:S1 family peptidase [Lentzea albidocapillata]|uniref:Streptogrisin D n=1 Tax=Lentzea albidocapillata TaxID=40571 RepID=A0A1W1ZKA1_9PSEU|nr:S1 family peptidase [Lentzea albidocapillata]SMC48965.1 streptogrisin D [Lentzea albidocapillata]